MIPFDQLTDRQQANAMRRVAMEALPAFGLEGSRLTLVVHAFNTTFRVRHPSREYAMRINVNSNRSPEAIAGELAWVQSISDEGKILVPKPRRTTSGGPFAAIKSPHFDEPRPVVCYGWIDGRTVTRRPSPRLAEMMGSTMAQLHEHATRFEFPTGTSRPLMKSVLEGEVWLLSESIFNDSLSRAEAALERCKKAAPPRVTHFDLHFRNVRRSGNRLAVFDFDDSVMAWPMVDAAQSMFYTRRTPDADALESAFWNGFGSRPADYGMSDDDFEDLVMGRALLLANELLKNKTANIAAYASRYVQLVRNWLVEYEKGGPFRPVGSLADIPDD